MQSTRGNCKRQDYDLGDEPPCIGCPNRDLCGSKELACGEFDEWTATGHVQRHIGERRPERKIWEKVFLGIQPWEPR